MGTSYEVHFKDHFITLTFHDHSILTAGLGMCYHPNIGCFYKRSDSIDGCGKRELTISAENCINGYPGEQKRLESRACF